MDANLIIREEFPMPPPTDADQLAINTLFAWLYQRGLQVQAARAAQATAPTQPDTKAEDVCAEP